MAHASLNKHHFVFLLHETVQIVVLVLPGPIFGDVTSLAWRDREESGLVRWYLELRAQAIDGIANGHARYRVCQMHKPRQVTGHLRF